MFDYCSYIPPQLVIRKLSLPGVIVQVRVVFERQKKLKAGLHVQRKHKHKQKVTYVSCTYARAYAYACVERVNQLFWTLYDALYRVDNELSFVETKARQTSKGLTMFLYVRTAVRCMCTIFCFALCMHHICSFSD